LLGLNLCRDSLAWSCRGKRGSSIRNKSGREEEEEEEEEEEVKRET
jgi:hypothetical protein